MAEMNYIIRVAGKDVDGTKRVEESIQGIKGLGQRISGMIAVQFRKETGLSKDKKLGEFTAEEVKKLEEIILNPGKHNLPEWSLNRQKDYETGEDKHLIMNDLAFSLRNDIQRMAEMKSYKGLRHMWGLPVRGQKTRSTHRGKGGTVSVTKKEEGKKGAAPAPKADKK
jgi:small subunit ribosomal protein S13